MTATIVVEEGNGSGPTWTVVTVSRYCTADNYNPGNTYPVVVPSANYSYSYWKHIRFAFSGTFTQLSNWRWYCGGTIKTDWSLGTGGMLLLFKRDSGDHGCPAASYCQAVGTEGQNGTYAKDDSAGHTFYKGETVEPVDADTHISTNAFPFDSKVYLYSEYPSGGATKAIVSQLRVGVGATQGDKSTQTATGIWDEI